MLWREAIYVGSSPIHCSPQYALAVCASHVFIVPLGAISFDQAPPTHLLTDL